MEHGLFKLCKSASLHLQGLHYLTGGLNYNLYYWGSSIRKQGLLAAGLQTLFSCIV